MELVTKIAAWTIGAAVLYLILTKYTAFNSITKGLAGSWSTILSTVQGRGSAFGVTMPTIPGQ